MVSVGPGLKPGFVPQCLPQGPAHFDWSPILPITFHYADCLV